MDVEVTVTAVELSDETIAEATRELLKMIRGDADPRARLVTQDAPVDSKGAAVALGQIVLGSSREARSRALLKRCSSSWAGIEDSKLKYRMPPAKK